MLGFLVKMIYINLTPHPHSKKQHFVQKKSKKKKTTHEEEDLLRYVKMIEKYLKEAPENYKLSEI